MLDLNQELDLFISRLPEIAADKRYWLIRTQSGSLYETFTENNFVAIEHDYLSLSRISQLYKDAKGDHDLLKKLIKSAVKEEYSKVSTLDDAPSRAEITRKANQIFRFLYETRKGDIVVIPSVKSDLISFGEIQEDYIGSFTPDEERKMECSYILKRRVKWTTHIPRRGLDPFLFRLFVTHQAVSDVSRYADIIERSLGNFFILDEQAHLILDVETEKEIPAKDLFGLGYDILQMVDDFAAYANIEISSRDLQVKINLNSPGKIDLKSKIKKTTFITGLLLLVVGGGYTGEWGTLKTEGIPGLMNAMTSFLDSRQERDLKQQIYNQYKDSLKVKDPEDLIKLMKQVSDNKDLPN